MARTANETKVVAFVSVAHALTHMYMLVFPATLMPMIRDSGRPLSDVAAYAFPGWLLFGLGSLPSGWLADRWSGRRMLTVNVLGCGVMACLCGLAPSLTWLAVTHAGLGLFASVHHPAGMSLLTRSVRKVGSALGINGMAGNFGLALAPFAAGLAATTLGWQAAWVMLGVSGLVVGAALLVVPFDESDVEPEEGPDAGGHPWPWFALLCVAMTFVGLAASARELVLPALFEARVSFLDQLVAPLEAWTPGGTGTVVATALASGVYLVAVVGQAAGGWVADHVELRRAYVACHALSLPFALLAAYATDLGLVAVMVVYAFFAMGMQPVENSLVARLSPPRLRASAYGVKFTLAFGVGALAVPVVGLVDEAAGLPAVFVAITWTISAVIALSVLLLWTSRDVHRI